MEKTKIFNNTDVVNAKNRIAAAVNAELNKGIPVSVVSMIIHMCAYEVDNLQNSAIAAEAAEKEVKKE